MGPIVNYSIFTVRNSSCGKVMFSQASVCLSTGGRGGVQPLGQNHLPARHTPPWTDTPGHTPPRQTHTPLARHPPPGDTPGQNPTQADTPVGRHPHPTLPLPPPRQTATALDGTHPTGIHSCTKFTTKCTDRYIFTGKRRRVAIVLKAKLI